MLIVFFLHTGAVYVGGLIAQLEYIDVWRAAVVAVVSYIPVLVIRLLLLPLLPVSAEILPLDDALGGAVILGLGTACAAKAVLSCDWQPAWIIGGTTLVANLAGELLYSSF